MTSFESKGSPQPGQPSEAKADGVASKPKKKARTRGQKLLLAHEIFMPPLSLRKQRNEMGFW
jgi:hypothetical protein